LFCFAKPKPCVNNSRVNRSRSHDYEEEQLPFSEHGDEGEEMDIHDTSKVFEVKTSRVEYKFEELAF